MRRLTASAALIAVAMLAGCSATNPAESTPMSEAEYLKQVKTLDSYATYSDDTLISLGEGMCSTFEEVSTPEQRNAAIELFVSKMENENGADTRELVALATGTYCPRTLPLK